MVSTAPPPLNQMLLREPLKMPVPIPHNTARTPTNNIAAITGIASRLCRYLNGSTEITPVVGSTAQPLAKSRLMRNVRKQARKGMVLYTRCFLEREAIVVSSMSFMKYCRPRIRDRKSTENPNAQFR